ncbi:hypothetical protein FJZ18_01790 [Candidatus Pacearchaeota archaeon]|nr:hypothetical protein [Candidatus Pacearchaeota archaeon]
MPKKVLLSLPEQIHTYLKHEKEVYAYSSLQQVILDALREHCFLNNQNKKPKKGKRGRPKDIDEAYIISHRLPFSKKGKDIDL